MISLIIIALLAMLIVSMTGYAVLEYIHSAGVFEDSRVNSARMESLASLLRSQVKEVNFDGVDHVPAGTLSAEGYTTLPGWLVTDIKTPWGVSYAYCPYSPDNIITAGADSVVMGDGASYPVNTAATAASGGQTYVTGSVAPPVPGVLAFILSPELDSSVVPNCDQVTFSAGRFSVPGGFVAAVTTDQVWSQRVDKAAVTLDYYVAPTATGEGSGLDPANQSTLDAAIASWLSVRPVRAIIHLADGTYSVTDTLLNQSALDYAANSGRALEFRGASQAGTVLDGGGAAFALTFPGVNLLLSDMTLGAGGRVSLIHQQAHLRNITLPDLTASLSRVVFDDSISFQQPAGSGGYGIVAGESDIVINSGTVSATYGALNAGFAYLSGGSFVTGSGVTLSLSARDGAGGVLLDGGAHGRLVSTTVSVSSVDTSSPGYLISVQGGSALEALSSTIEGAATPQVGIEAAGDVELVATDLGFPNQGDVGIRLSGGARLTLDGGSRIGRAPSEVLTTGIVDVGGAGVYGANATVYGVSCWNTADGLFSESQDVNGATSAPVAGASKVVQILNRSSWTCVR